MNKAHENINFQDLPIRNTPLAARNLNKMDHSIDVIDDRVIALDAEVVKDVAITNTLQTGDTIATITVDGTATNIKSAQVEVDTEPSATSENPLQNKAIYEMLNNLLPEGSESGNPISIDDASGLNAKACSVDLLPIQDLHGYDSPWVGGAGKNKFNIDGFSDTQRTVVASVNNGVLHLQGTVTAGGVARFALPTTQNIPTGSVTLSVSGSNENIRVVAQGNNGFQYISQYGNFTKTFTITDTVTLSYFYVDVADGTTVNADVKIQIESGSTATTFAPYSNICPISGRNSVEVKRTGKNLFNNTAETTTTQGITLTVNSDGTITGQNNATGTAVLYLANVSLPNGNYILNGCPSGGGNTYKLDISKDGTFYTDNGSGVSFTVTDQTPYLVRLVVYSGNGNGKVFKPMIRLASIADDTYEPYQGETYTETLGQTVYGGNVDFVNGGATTNTITFKLNSETLPTEKDSKNRWVISTTLSNASSEYFDKQWLIAENPLQFGFYSERIQIKGEWVAVEGETTCALYGHAHSVEYRIRIADTYTAEEALAIANANEIAYRTTPTTLTTSAEQISLLKGNNVVSTDGDNINLLYSKKL